MTDNTSPGRRGRRATDVPADPSLQAVLQIDSLLGCVIQMNASDLHLAAGTPPTVRVDGELVRIPNAPVLSPDMAETLVRSLMTDDQRSEFEREWELDFSFGRRGLGRYRVGAFRERGDASAVLRRIPDTPLQLDELGLPRVVGNFAAFKQGLVLVTGPSGAGKTTTLTAIIDKINRERNVHVITVEDPIEFVHVPRRAMIQQREVGKDTTAFARALRSALREDPDVLLIGEMRDLETIAAAVSAAETGHLVFATLHTNSAAQSIDRMIDAFPPHQQTQIRLQLAASLQAVVSQRLLPLIDGGRVCVAEVLIVTGAIRNLVREGKTHQIESAMQIGQKDGMVIFDTRLAELVRQRKVSREVALSYCTDASSFDARLTAAP
jgi:twitching motility protein PilT